MFGDIHDKETQYTYFKEWVRGEMRRSERYHRPFSIVALEIGSSKTQGDTEDIISEDIIFKIMVKLLRYKQRASDFVARFGTSGFIMILPETDKKGASTFTERIKVHLKDFLLDEEGFGDKDIVISKGIATFPEDGMTNDELYKVVNEALNESKKKVRGDPNTR
ncbi:MAG: diguanylate cyclase [bacterium]|nr:diguanylate cyclase [bacterium]